MDLPQPIMRARNSVLTRDRMSTRRVLIKQSYLKKLANAAKIGANFKTPHRRWFVFGVMNGSDPYLEYYESEDATFTGAPINMFFLNACKKVLKNRNNSRYNNTFTIVLLDRDLTLIAETRALMNDWCTAITQKLLSMGVFVDDDAEHIYVTNPVSRPLPRDKRDQFYPNRPRRILSSDRTNKEVTTEQAGQSEFLVTDLHSDLQRLESLEEETSPPRLEAYEEPNSARRLENSYAVPQAEMASSNVQPIQPFTAPDTPPSSPDMEASTATYTNSKPWLTFGDMEAQPVLPESPPPLPLTTRAPDLTSRQLPPVPAFACMETVAPGIDSPPTSPPPPVPIILPPPHPTSRRLPPVPTSDRTSAIMTCSPPTTPITPTTPIMPTTPVSPAARSSFYANFPSLMGPLPGNMSPPVVSDVEPEFSLLTPKVLEASGVEDMSDAVFGWNMPPPDADAPPLYMPPGALERGANRSLKHSQAEQLKHEQANPGGVRVLLKKIDCLYAIAFVDMLKAVWIAGWNQKARPHLYSAFHVGDQLVSINGQVVENAKMAVKLIKNCTEDDKLTFIIKRVPHGRVFAMKRIEQGQDLGITRKNDTPEITGLDEMGPAAEAGLSLRALAMSGTDFCNWWITEVNNQPLNLFCKENEQIQKRLNAVGLDISMLVHPLDFITELKKKLKMYRNYKDFLL